jgi:hypothetical protein
MKYFQTFLNENECGYEDVDISVHCDVKIFEWLMKFIHDRDDPPLMEKSIVISILISSEFLQMEALVNQCLLFIASSLSDIIRLPIDLSCVAERLINKLALLVSPRVLATTKDRRDKIVNKLYKRRVEIDFSRKAPPRGGRRSIAASLSCCRQCGMVYLESWEKKLDCAAATAHVDFRGRLVKRHMSVSGWSLTNYLKSLHIGGMSWEYIYWHVWASCQVVAAGNITVSLLEIWRYNIETDGLTLLSPGSIAATAAGTDLVGSDSGGRSSSTSTESTTGAAVGTLRMGADAGVGVGAALRTGGLDVGLQAHRGFDIAQDDHATLQQSTYHLVATKVCSIFTYPSLFSCFREVFVSATTRSPTTTTEPKVLINLRHAMSEPNGRYIVFCQIYIYR